MQPMTEEAAARILQQAFRKLASESAGAYSHMFSMGADWKELREIDIKSGSEIFDLSKEHVRYGEENMIRLINSIGELDEIEQELFDFFRDQKFYAVHATNANIRMEHGGVGLLSRNLLQTKSIAFSEENTQEIDISNVASDRFVFFSLEIGDKLTKPSSRFGSAAYRFKIDEHPSFRRGLISLFDPATGKMPKAGKHIRGLSHETATSIANRGPFEMSEVIYPISGAESLTSSQTIGGLLPSSIISISRTIKKTDGLALLSAWTTNEANELLAGLFRPQIMPPGTSIHPQDVFKQKRLENASRNRTVSQVQNLPCPPAAWALPKPGEQMVAQAMT
ncbi:hypothetical protein, partial [Burkholderia ubonensis]|uniref:hypothetical protein n=1 Tax=Burkholderia ubonensis TaxID=101571 RepID=UPI000A4C2A33